MDPFLLFVLAALVFMMLRPKESLYLPGYNRTFRPYPHSKPAGYPVAGKPWFMTQKQTTCGNGLPYGTYGGHYYY